MRRLSSSTPASNAIPTLSLCHSYLESLWAFVEMIDAGLLPAECPTTTSVGRAGAAPTCVPRATVVTAIEQVTDAIGSRLGSPQSGEFVTWFGCSCANATASTCQLPAPATAGGADPCVQPWDIRFLPAQALAVKLGVTPGGSTAATGPGAAAALATLRDLGRVGYGQFRTNVRSIESVNPSIWLARDRWHHVTRDGFAGREANQSGDWHMFANASSDDGNGAYGLQEENGGRLLSTTAFLFEVGGGGGSANPASPLLPRAGPYPQLYADWKAFVGTLANITAQLQAGDTSRPLLPGARGALRAPMAPGDIPQTLCAAARGPGSLATKE
jgi:hypothetical protein